MSRKFTQLSFHLEGLGDWLLFGTKIIFHRKLYGLLNKSTLFKLSFLKNMHKALKLSLLMNPKRGKNIHHEFHKLIGLVWA
jgi:hypothetical protein